MSPLKKIAYLIFVGQNKPIKEKIHLIGLNKPLEVKIDLTG